MFCVFVFRREGSKAIQRVTDALLVVVMLLVFVLAKFEDFQGWRVAEFPRPRVRALVTNSSMIVGQLGGFIALTAGLRLFSAGKSIEGIAAFGLMVLVECTCVSLFLQIRGK